MAVLALATTLLVSACGSPQSTAAGSGTASAGQPTAISTTSGQPTATSAATPGQVTADSGAAVAPQPPVGTTVKYSFKAGVAESAQMAQIYDVAKAFASKKYDDAAAAGYYTFDKTGALTQDPQEIAQDRDKHASIWDEVKTALDTPGCVLTPDHKNSSGVIMIPIWCSGMAKPTLSIHAQYLGNKLAYLDVIYGDGTEN